MSLLSQAMAYLVNGRRIPLDLAARLMAAGYDVKALEERHLG